MEQPPQINTIFKFLRLHQEYMFMFDDEKAALSYERHIGEVVYIIANFDKSKGEFWNTILAKTALQASMN